MSGRRPAGRRRTRGPARASGLLALALLLSLPACAHLFGGSGRPSGLGSWDHRLRGLLANGSHEEALALVNPDRARAGDELLRLQHETAVAHYAGEWERSSKALERAVRLDEDRYTKSVSKALLSVLANDRVLDYDPPPPERLFLHYYGALNYLRQGEPGEAAVEARRLGSRLGDALEDGGDAVPSGLGRALSHFAGAVFEAAGMANDAAVAYRRARAFGREGDRPAGRPSGAAPGREPFPGAPPAGPDRTRRAAADSAGPVHAGTSRQPLSGAGSGAARRRAGPDATPPTGEVVVLVERGFVARKVERDLTVLLFRDELETLRGLQDVEDPDREEAREALGVAERVAERSLDGARGDGRGGSGEAHGDPDPLLLRVAWPAYRDSYRARGLPTLVVDGDTTDVEPVSRMDLSHAVKAAYRERRTLDLAKTLLRAAAKAAVADLIEEEVSDEDETLGEIAGWTARIAGAVLERADTRCWHLLPDRIEMYRLRLPAGTHRLEARVPRPGREPQTVALGQVDVAPGAVRVVSGRVWR